MINLFITLVIVGLCLYLVEAYIPIPAPIKTVIRVVVVLFLVVYLFQSFGIVGPGVPRLR